MRVRMPDGTIVDNVPEGTTQEELQALLNGRGKAPVEEEPQAQPNQPAQPGSAGYIAQGPAALLETGGRMFAGMMGGAGGALGSVAGAVEEAFRGEFDAKNSAERIRRGIEEGMEATTKNWKPQFAPTAAMEEQLGNFFHGAREHLGDTAEVAELGRGKVARTVTPEALHPLVKERPELARTAAEYMFDAGGTVAGVTAPLSAARSMGARQAPARPAEARTTEQPASPDVSGSFNPESIVERAIRENEPATRKEPAGTVYEVPETPVERPRSPETEATVDAIRRYQEGGEARDRPITEQERTANAIREARRQTAFSEDETIRAVNDKTYDEFYNLLDRTGLREEFQKAQKNIWDAHEKGYLADLEFLYKDQVIKEKFWERATGQRSIWLKRYPEYKAVLSEEAAPKGWDKVEGTPKSAYELRLEERMSTGSLHETLKEIATSSNSSFNRLAARLLTDLNLKTSIRHSNQDFLPAQYRKDSPRTDKWGGEYMPQLDAIAIRKEGLHKPIEQVVLHEAIHAAVYTIQIVSKVAWEQQKPISLFGKFTSQQQFAATKMAELYHTVIDSFSKLPANKFTEFQIKSYGFKNEFEFVAEAFSNPQFQRVLQMIDIPASSKPGMRGILATVRNTWDAFVELVRETLRLPVSETNALRLALHEGAKLIRTSTEEARKSLVDTDALKDSAFTEAGDGRTSFEREENLPRGAGLAVPDLKTPLETRVAETIQLGKDMVQNTSKQFFEKLPNDIGSFFSKYLLNPEQLSKFIGESNPLVKAVIDRVADKKRYWAELREDLIKGSRLLTQSGLTALRYTKREAAGFSGIIETLGKNEQEAFFKARLEFDQADILTEMGLQWPTREMLAERGYSQKVIDAYMKETEYMDAAYRLINWARELTGKDPIKRIPGYFPHTYKGHMGIKIYRVMTHPETGAESLAPVGFTKAGGGMKQVTAAAEELIAQIARDLHQQGQTDIRLKPEVYRTDKPGSTPDVIDALETVGQIFNNPNKPLVKLIQTVLQRRMASLEQQFLQAQLRRHGVEGWIGSSGVTAKNLDQLVTARTNYMESVVKFAESQDILTHIHEAIGQESWNTLLRKMPNTADFISKVVDVARDKFRLSEFDKTALNFFAEKTGDRFTYRAPIMGLNKLRGFFSAKDLAWSASYHIGNGIQPEMMGSLALMREYSRMGIGDPAMAMLMAEKEFISPRPENINAIQWAAKNKVTTPKLMEEIDFFYGRSGNLAKEVGKDIVTGRRASELNEAVGRLRTFIMGLEYYRSAGLTEVQSRQAAAKFVDDVMVDYSVSGQPLWLSSNPGGQFVGRAIAPYAAFRHSFWGQTALAVQGIKNNPTLARKFLPFVQLQVATAAFGGLRGMAFMAEAVALATMFNQMWENIFNEPGPVMNPMEVMLEKGFGDFAMFGALSTASKSVPGMGHGADIGASVAAPQAMEAITPRAIEGTWDALKESKTFFNILFGTATDSDKLRLIKTITPNYTHGIFEAAFTKRDDILADENNRMKGNIRREEEDWRARILTGKRSLTEQRQLLAKNLNRTAEMKGKERKGDLTELAADFFEKEGYLSPELVEKAIDEGYRYREFKERVDELVEQRGKTRLESLYHTKKRTRTRERIRARIDDLTEGVDY